MLKQEPCHATNVESYFIYIYITSTLQAPVFQRVLKPLLENLSQTDMIG